MVAEAASRDQRIRVLSAVHVRLEGPVRERRLDSVTLVGGPPAPQNGVPLDVADGGSVAHADGNGAAEESQIGSSAGAQSGVADEEQQHDCCGYSPLARWSLELVPGSRSTKAVTERVDRAQDDRAAEQQLLCP